MAKNFYLDIHVLQTVPPNCINRDDTGSPKTAVYGGTMRARVSSQAWKRAMRTEFKSLFSEDKLGYRTRNAGKVVSGKIQERNPEIGEQDADKWAAEILKLIGVKADTGKNDVLFFISSGQICALADLAIKYAAAVEGKGEKKAGDEFKGLAKEAVNQNPSVDILLFGRMAASDPSLNFDAAAQVAHSISTHTVSTEFDYFTAMDDCGDEDNAGAAYIDTTEFNSSTLYRYATVNIRELAENLTGEELGQAARGFTEAFIRSMPTGKQNSFANRTLPELVYVTARDDQPVNLAGAFERPVPASKDGYAEKSEKVLFAYANTIYENYTSEPIRSWIIGKEQNYPGEKVNLRQLLEKVEKVAESYKSLGE